MADAKAIVAEAANRYGVRPDVLWGVYGTETGFGSNVKASSAGAVGPFQFEPGTAKSLGINPYNFKEAAFGAAKYLSQFKGRGTAGMLSAYNAGPAGGIQQDYVNKTLANARQYGGPPAMAVASGKPATPAQEGQRYRTGSIEIPGTRTYNTRNFNAQGFEEARSLHQRAKLIGGLGPPEKGGVTLKGILTQKFPAPTRGEYESSTEHPGTPGSKVNFREAIGGTGGKLGAPGTSGRVPQGHELHGLLPAGARVLEWNRKDQGRDVQLTPGQVLLATGNGYVIRNGSDPSGFGPSYPIVHLETGPEAGKDVYYGHTDSLVKPGQRLVAGQPVAKTSKTGHNAKPGWLEYGFAPGGTPGPFGQPSPF